jgi:hypothetical protein
MSPACGGSGESIASVASGIGRSKEDPGLADAFRFIMINHDKLLRGTGRITNKANRSRGRAGGRSKKIIKKKWELSPLLSKIS